MSTVNVNRVVDASGGVLAPISSVHRNRIINGSMTVDQRNAGASVTNTAGVAYTLDRWASFGSQASKFTVQQNAGSVTPPAGFKNYLGVTSSSAYTVGSSEGFWIRQPIEGFNVADLGWGTANAKTVTLSFWVRSSLTGTFGGALIDNFTPYSYPFSYTISAANTWEQKTVTITAPTSGTFPTGNTTGIFMIFGLGNGSTLSGTAGSWQSANLQNATGATSVVGTNGATFYITGVQLEVGTQATGFEYRQYGQELALCQRYFYQPDLSTILFAMNWGGNSMGTFKLAQTMRVAPTCTGTTSATLTATFASKDNVQYYMAGVTGTSVGAATMSAEL